jgi:hypothetical protein
LVSIKWMNISLGVATDKNNTLYVIRNNTIRPMPIPFATDSSTPLSYDVSKTGKLYVSNGQYLYYGSVSGVLKNIYTKPSDVSGIEVYSGVDKAAVIESRGENKSTIVLVNESGQIAKKDVVASNIEWSSDGQHLLAIGDFGNAIVLDASLNKITDINIKKGSNFIWKDDNNIFYSISNQLWNYNVDTNTSSLIANMPSGLPGDGDITSIFPTSNNSYVYLNTKKIDVDGSNEGDRLFRVGLSGQSVANYLNSLSIFLPETINNDNCSINYINFTKPTILIQYWHNTTALICTNATKAELTDYDVDPSNFQYITQLFSD